MYHLYQLLSSALPWTIGDTFGTIKVPLPSYPINKCILLRQNHRASISSSQILPYEKQVEHLMMIKSGILPLCLPSYAPHVIVNDGLHLLLYGTFKKKD